MASPSLYRRLLDRFGSRHRPAPRRTPACRRPFVEALEDRWVPALLTPTFSNLAASQSIVYGDTSLTLSGRITGTGGPVTGYVLLGASSLGASTSIDPMTGDFSHIFTITGANTPQASATAYNILYAYAGDSTTYDFAFDTSTQLTVDPRPITVTAVTDSKPYDGNTSSDGVPTLTSGTLAFSETATYSQTFDNKNAGTGKSLTPSATVSSGNSNYDITYVNDTTGEITPLPLTANFSGVNKNYDNTTTTTATFVDFTPPPIGGDDVSATYTAANFDNASPGAGKTVTVTGIALDGADKDNYSLSSTTATTTADITAVATYLDNSDFGMGFSQVGAWTLSTLGGYKGNRSYPTNGAGIGANTSTWAFSSLPGGQYNVAITWVAQSNRATNSPFSVLVNGVVQGTSIVNQQLVPNDFTDAGFGWKVLALVNVPADGGALEVRLSDNVGSYPPGNGFVIADAVRIQAVRTATPVRTIDNTTPPAAPGGFAQVGAWSFSVLGGIYGNRSFPSAGPGTGANTSTWTFNTVPAGSYRLAATWVAQSNRATNSPFTILVDSVSQGTVSINQQISPASFSDQGVPWQYLGGTLTLGATSTVAVRLSDNVGSYPPGNGFVIADAVMLLPSTFVPASINSITSSPVRIIDDSEAAGFATTGAWTTSNLAGYDGERMYAPAGAGQSKATWTFAGLTAGNYRISVTWTAQSNRATNSPFTVFTGNGSSSTVLVNQQQAPDDFTSEGASWEDLGTFYVVGNQLVVQLSNNADGYVIADAIRIEWIGP